MQNDTTHTIAQIVAESPELTPAAAIALELDTHGAHDAFESFMSIEIDSFSDTDSIESVQDAYDEKLYEIIDPKFEKGMCDRHWGRVNGGVGLEEEMEDACEELLQQDAYDSLEVVRYEY